MRCFNILFYENVAFLASLEHPFVRGKRKSTPKVIEIKEDIVLSDCWEPLVFLLKWPKERINKLRNQLETNESTSNGDRMGKVCRRRLELNTD